MLTIRGDDTIESSRDTGYGCFKAAAFWATARQQGQPTADDNALDADVILAAQAYLLSEEEEDPVIATTNVGHLSRFVKAQE